MQVFLQLFLNFFYLWSCPAIINKIKTIPNTIVIKVAILLLVYLFDIFV